MRKLFVDAGGRLRSGWALLLFFVALTLASGALGQLVLQLGFRRLAGTMILGEPAHIPTGLARLAAPLLATWAGCAVVRQRLGDAGLSDRRWLRRLGAGAALGAFTVSASVTLSWLFELRQLGPSTLPAGELLLSGLVQLAVLAPASAGEELMLRGFAFQQVARGIEGIARRLAPGVAPGSTDPEGRPARLGRHGAVILTGTLFGLLHAGNPNVSRLAVLNIVLVGLWFGLLVARTGSLWIGIGAHTGWNWFQGFVWGEPISGLRTAASLLHARPLGDALWTGGEFGPEASAITSAVLAILLLVTLAWRPAPGSARADTA